jgi:hypothetical protein
LKSSAIKLVLFGALLGSSFFAVGQANERAVGLRWAYGSGFSFREMMTDKHAVEGIFTARWGGVALTGLFQRHHQVASVDGMFWYYGGGLHMGVHRRSNIRPNDNPALEKAMLNVGADLIVGIGYRFNQFPVDLTLDFKPTISFTTTEWVPETFGLTGRWRF